MDRLLLRVGLTVDRGDTAHNERREILEHLEICLTDLERFQGVVAQVPTDKQLERHNHYQR